MAAGNFSLRRVRLRNYRSIASVDVELGDLLVLVGPNGSGKSNFLDALRFVADSLLTSPDQAFRSRGGIGEVRRHDGRPGRIDMDLDFDSEDVFGTYGFTITSTTPGGFRISREACEIRRGSRRRGHEQLAWYQVTNGNVEHSEAVAPPVSTDRLYLVAAAGLDVFRPVFDGLSGINVFNLNPDAMRQPQSPGPGDVLSRNGANAASVLHRLQGERKQATKKLIEAYLNQIVPGMHTVSRKELGSWETLQFMQDKSKFQASSVSDGTLRALGILVALYASTGPTHSPIGIEEPESALHPAATAVLFDALRDASARRQVLVTSHSPDLLDRDDFTLDEILAVRFVDTETKIGRLDAAGALALREHLFTPGELLRKDQLLPESADLTS